MKFPSIFRRKAAVTPLAYGDGWPVIREAYAGAWQSHVSVDSPRDVTTFPAVYACVTKIASDIAKMRWRLMREEENGTCMEVREASPFKGVLEHPNPYQNRIQFVQHWLAVKLLAGKSYGLKERDARGVVRRVHELDPQRVKVLVTDFGDVYYELAPNNLSGLQKTVTVPASEIIHDRMPSFWHPLEGLSPLYAAGLPATMGNRIQKNSTRFFQNMSQAGGALVAPGKLDGEDAAKLKREWEANYSGDNAGRTAVLANGLKFERFSIPAHEAQLVQQFDSVVKQVASAFHMPLHKIGGEIPANTSVESLNQQYYSECLQILIEALELCMTEGLELPAGLFVEFDLDGLLRMDSAALHESLAKAVGAGYMTPNEARKRVNLPPVAGGNECYLQQQNYGLAALNKRDTGADPFGKKTEARPAPQPPAANEEAYAAAFEDIFIKGLRASAA